MSERKQSKMFQPDLLTGKVAIVSGFGTGLGRAIALELSAMGATVIGCGRRRELLDQTVEMIRANGGVADAVALDIRDDDAVSGFIDYILAKHGRLDVLVNNAGGQFVGPAENVSPKGFRTVVELNMIGTWMMTHAAATKAFIPQQSGRVISITVAPHNGAPGAVTTCAARAGVENMMRTLSLEWGRHGISFICVAAGPFMTDVVAAKYPPALVATWGETTTLGRVGTPEEMGYLVGFLATPQSEYVTGGVVTIDGGADNGPNRDSIPLESRDNNFRAKQTEALKATVNAPA
jgi:citronellol/citronellal dehydrogenase